MYVLVNQKMQISTVQYVLFYITGRGHWFYHTCSYATQTVALGIQEELSN